jgi:hypothetical protein
VIDRLREPRARRTAVAVVFALVRPPCRHRIGYIVLFRPGLVEGGRLRSPGSPIAAAGLGRVSSPDPAVRVVTLGAAAAGGPYPTRCTSRE